MPQPWQEEEARRKAELVEQRHAEEARQLSHTPETPHSWITAFTPQLAAYRAPLYVTVQGVRLLMHPSLLPQAVLSETLAGRYVFKDSALRFIPASGTEQYASARLGLLLDQLLMGTVPATPQAEELLAQVRAVLNESSAALRRPRSAQEHIAQPTLWS